MTQIEEERAQLLKDAVSLTMNAAYGIQKMSDQQVANVIGGLVRSKLLSADDSYRLKDEISGSSALEVAIEERIEAALKRKGIASDSMLGQIRARLRSMTQKQS